MKFIVGLGNIGEKYIKTRHNTGFLFVEFIKNVMGLTANFLFEKKMLAEIAKEKEIVLIKSQTYMNSCGLAVAKVLNYYNGNISDLIVCYDDLDIEFGKWKITKGVGPRAHNGVNSVIEQIGSENFWHIRIGSMGEEYKFVKDSGKSLADEYILKDFSKKEMERLYEVFGKVFDEGKEKGIF